MNKEHFDKWIKALRSGEYSQGFSVLKSQWDDYCCLGVGCAVAGIPIEEDQALPHLDFYHWLGVEEWRDDGMRWRDGVPEDRETALGAKVDGVWWDVATMNDQRMSFDEIADFLEANRDGLALA